ncbi:hypothetical protein AMAG_11673 [Allomyces macrogynus ATCC 38327]|uniref:Transmembrane protein 198 n=1 Tax=Allomyces macrogynus (strain ATCC 38327) TaxID=578462 RepID=A0A0L0SVE1_ALLM3|nr:hypothetical protein AMAG_11673 [Allomyces macrogynus ATCC 38327]|eukprot:KNE66543.1 hypothetical protein AMAG_11673 [Allomyces macrogynus ATCC 38327]
MTSTLLPCFRARWPLFAALSVALFATLFSTLAHASPLPGDNVVTDFLTALSTNDVPVPGANGEASKLLADSIVLGAIMIVTGLLFTFFGGKLFRVCLFLVGAYIFATIAFAVLQYVEPDTGFNNRKAIYWGVGATAAVLGGALLTFFWKVGLFAIGCFGGYTFALWLLALASGGIIKSASGQAIFVAVFALVGGISMFWVEKHTVRVCTALGGAYFTVLGVDVFAQTGFSNSTKVFLGSSMVKYETSAAIYGMIAFFVVLAALGMAAQYKYTAKVINFKSIRGSE